MKKNLERAEYFLRIAKDRFGEAELAPLDAAFLALLNAVEELHDALTSVASAAPAAPKPVRPLRAGGKEEA